MDIFSILFYQPLFNFTIVLYRLLGENLGLAIIAVALVSRLVTIPISLKQAKMAEQSKELNAKLKEVREKYKKDKEKQSQELLKIQSEYLPAQLAGCLPLIIQFIVLISINHIVTELFSKGASSFNAVAYSIVPQFAEGYAINYNFFGLSLQFIPSQLLETGLLTALPYVLLALLVAVSQYFSTKMMLGNTNVSTTEAKQGKSAKGKTKSEETPDFAEIMQQSTRNTMIILPALLFFMSLNFAAGLSLYWTVQSGFVIIQMLLFKRFNLINVQPK